MTQPPMIDLNDAEATADLFRTAAASLRTAVGRRGASMHIAGEGHLLATGDLHDNPMHFQAVVRMARLDAHRSRHLTLHELIHGEQLVNGMDFSYRILARVAHLVLAYPGQVHPLLANHELAQLTGRGVSKGAGNSVVLFQQALDYVYGDDAITIEEAIHDFIRAMPLALRSESGVLCAHSLPAIHVMSVFDPDVLNRDLTDDDYAHPDGSAYLMTWGRDHSDEQIRALADTWGANLFILGHRHVEAGIECTHPLVVVLNSDHEQGRCLPIDLAQPMPAEEAPMYAVPLTGG